MHGTKCPEPIVLNGVIDPLLMAEDEWVTGVVSPLWGPVGGVGGPCFLLVGAARSSVWVHRLCP